MSQSPMPEIPEDPDFELIRAGRAFLEAGREFWQIHQKHFGTETVVWIEDIHGALAVFTPGEGKEALLASLQVEVMDAELTPENESQ